VPISSGHGFGLADLGYFVVEIFLGGFLARRKV